MIETIDGARYRDNGPLTDPDPVARLHDRGHRVRDDRAVLAGHAAVQLE
jgi:hypothetical protein